MGKPLRIIKKGLIFHMIFPWCFFVGAYEGKDGKCGGGILINLSY